MDTATHLLKQKSQGTVEFNVMSSEKSCGAVIFKRDGDRKYLLLQYLLLQGGHWDFVKGHVEKNESERETVLRETEEEVGIIGSNFIEGFRQPIGYYYRRDGKTIYKKVIFYLIESRTDAVRLSREHVGYDWLSYNYAHERLTYKNAKETLRKAHEYLKAMA